MTVLSQQIIINPHLLIPRYREVDARFQSTRRLSRDATRPIVFPCVIAENFFIVFPYSDAFHPLVKSFYSQ